LKSKIRFSFSEFKFSICSYFGFTTHEQTFNTRKDIQIGDINVLQLSLAKYMPENKDTWHRLATREKLDESAFDYATWDFIGECRFRIDKTANISLLDFVLGRTFDDHGDMTKARQYGWTTTVDTNKCYMQCFDRLKNMKIIPLD
jgi:hypothetical protein